MILLITLMLNFFQIEEWLNNEKQSTELIEILNKSDKQIDNEISGFEYYYRKSLINLYKGKIYLDNNQKKESIKSLEQSMDFAMEALKLREDSDCWRVMADAGSALMLQKGLPYIIQNSGKINDYALKSLEIDSMNSKAHIIVAAGLINAPPIFGGDIKKGISILKNLIIDEDDKEASLTRSIILTEAYIKIKDRDSAKKSLNEGFINFPQNKKLNKLKLSLEG